MSLTITPIDDEASVVTYRGCRLEVFEVDAGWEIEIQPHSGIQVRPSRILPHRTRAAAMSDARLFVDESLS